MHFTLPPSAFQADSEHNYAITFHLTHSDDDEKWTHTKTELKETPKTPA